MVSRFPRLSTVLLALAEKFRDDNVSDKFEASGHMCTISKVFELPPKMTEQLKKYMSQANKLSYEITKPC